MLKTFCKHYISASIHTKICHFFGQCFSEFFCKRVLPFCMCKETCWRRFLCEICGLKCSAHTFFQNYVGPAIIQAGVCKKLVSDCAPGWIAAAPVVEKSGSTVLGDFLVIAQES